MEKTILKPLKIDRRKLVSAKTYAQREGVTLKTVYDWIKQGKVNTDAIDGITFIVLP